MKKIATVVLALIFAMSLSTAAFAGEQTITAVPGDTSFDVMGSYNAGTTTDKYSVDVEWGEMKFTYNEANSTVWDEASHEYKVTQAAGWSCADKANIVTVTNHSSKAVNVEFLFEKNADIDSNTSTYTGTFDNSTANLAPAVGTTVENAPKAAATLSLDGTLAPEYTSGIKLGTVTVKLTEAA